MNCKKCNAPLAPDAKFCEICGTRVSNDGATNTKDSIPTPPTPPRPPMPPRGGQDDFGANAGFSAKRIRKWFKGNKPKWPIVLTVLGVISYLSVVTSEFYRYYGVGNTGTPIIIILIGALSWVLTWRTSGSLEEVNRAWNTYINIVSQRGLKKLNLIQEEVSLIEPIVLIGCGEKPNDSFAISKAQAMARLNIFKTIFAKIKGIFKQEYDPEEKYRIDEHNILHSLLLQVSVYMFSGNQVYLYVGNVDISTGLIYKERTSEVFFEDIEGLNFEQEVMKIYNEKKKKRVNKVIESFVLYLAGCKLSSSVLLESNDMSLVENQLAGMRNLIRDKKNA